MEDILAVIFFITSCGLAMAYSCIDSDLEDAHTCIDNAKKVLMKQNKEINELKKQLEDERKN